MWSTAIMFAMLASAHAAEPMSIGKLTMLAKDFKGQEVTVEASLGMVMNQAASSNCKRKFKGVILMPKATSNGIGGIPGAKVEACLTPAKAVDVVDAGPGTPLQATGTVKYYSSLGNIYAVTLEDASIELLGSTAETEPAADTQPAPAQSSE